MKYSGLRALQKIMDLAEYYFPEKNQKIITSIKK